MRTYETVFIVKPDVGADKLTEHLEFYKGNITKHGGEIINVEMWGKLTLAYEIDNHTEGNYFLIQFKANNDYNKELDLRFKYNEDVMRHIIVMLDEKKFKLKPRKDAVKRERKSVRADGAAETQDIDAANLFLNVEEDNAE